MGTKFIGAVLYDGPSKLDSTPIVVILSGFKKSRNAKTGAMLQTWIMRKDMDPAEAIRRGLDDAVCGDCKQRRNKGGACYVVVEKAPLSVWRAWKRGRYADWTQRFPDNALRGRSVRIGSYGDPAAVPVRVWRRVRSQKLSGWTGYTHQWRDTPQLRPFIMASVDSPSEFTEASDSLWRTFRVRDETEPNMPGEITCPSDRTTCEACNLCQGTSKLASAVSIVAHGFLAMRLRKKLPSAA